MMNNTLMTLLNADQRRMIENIREAAQRIWACPLHHHFTDHTVTHSERIIALLDSLTAGVMSSSKRLSSTEILILLSSAYLHDIGMQNERFAGGDLEQIRDSHNDQTAEMIYAAFQGPADAFPIPVSRDPTFANAIALVSKGHRKADLSAAEYEPFAYGNETIRLRLLAALLRFGDELDIDHRRVILDQMKLLKLPIESQLHWWKCYYVSGVSIEDEYIKVFYRFPENRLDYQDLIIPLVESEIRAKLVTLEEIFRADAVKVAIAKPEMRPMPLVQPLPPEVEAFAKRKVDSGNQLLVKTEISHAEQMITEKRHLDAAQAFANAAAAFARMHEAAQARHYAVKAAEQFREGGDRLEATRQYLQAAEVWLNNTRSPEIAMHELEQAHNLAAELDVLALRIQVLLAEAWAAFATLRDDDAQQFGKQAKELLPRVDDEMQRAKLLRTLSLQQATFAMVWEKWDIAREVLDAALAACPETARDERLDLLQSLLLVSTECGDWGNADRAYKEAQQLLGTMTEPRYPGLLAMHYGASLARRGSLEDAYNVYSAAIQQLDNQANAYILGLAYQNMQYMLLRNGALFFAGMEQHEARRMDLFVRTQSENKGYAHELRANDDLGARNYRGALQHARLALVHHWREGAWMGIEQAYRTLAMLNAATGRPVEALFAAIRGNDGKAAEQYSETLRDTGNAEMLTEVVSTLLTVRPAACEQQVAVEALGVLADVIPPKLLEQTVNHLISLLQGPGDNQQHIAVRRHAAEALRHHYLIPQLNTDQTNKIVQVALDQLQRQQFWTVTEELLKLLEEYFNTTQCRVDPSLYEPVTEAMLTFSGDDHLRSYAERVAVLVARTGPPDVRTQVVRYLKDRSDNLDSLSYLILLGEPISEEQLSITIEQVLRAINPRPVLTGHSTSIAFSGITPRRVNTFNEILPHSLRDHVIDGLLEAIINEHNNLGTRRDAIWALSDLPTNMLVERANEIADYLLWGAEGTLPRSSLVEMELQSQVNPFSNFRMYMGNIEQARQSSLRALGRLYPHVDQEHRERIDDSFIVASRDRNPTVRQGVAMALDAIEGGVVLPRRLLLALLVLLNDSDAGPCSWACAASGHLVARRLADSFVEDILERLLILAETELMVDVRVGVAVGLQALTQSNWLDATVREHVLATLAKLSSDVSFRVRREATRK